MAARWTEWEAAGFKILGGSVAGVGTSFYVSDLGVCLDVANGPETSHHAKHYLITHGHSDHASGIPYVLSQRALNKLPPAPMYMPEVMIDPLKKIIDLWMCIENHEYKFDFRPVKVGESVELKGDYFFRAFPSPHRIPTVGYTIFRKFKKLKKELLGLDGHRIAELKSRGERVEDEFEEPLLTYTGDTTIEFLDGPDWVRKSKSLLMEVTYADSRKPVEEARKWGHIHLDELVSRISDLEDVGELVLVHSSRRYSVQEFRKIVFERLPERWRERVRVAPYAPQQGSTR